MEGGDRPLTRGPRLACSLDAALTPAARLQTPPPRPMPGDPPLIEPEEDDEFSEEPVPEEDPPEEPDNPEELPDEEEPEPERTQPPE